MAKSLPLPDGTSVTIREGETPEETWARAIREYPEAFQPPAPKAEVSGPTIGGQTKEFFKGLIPGGIGLVEQAGIGISALLPEEQEKATQQYIKEAAATAKAPFAAAPGYEDINNSIPTNYKQKQAAQQALYDAEIKKLRNESVVDTATRVGRGLVGYGEAGLNLAGQLTGYPMGMLYGVGSNVLTGKNEDIGKQMEDYIRDVSYDPRTPEGQQINE